MNCIIAFDSIESIEAYAHGYDGETRIEIVGEVAHHTIQVLRNTFEREKLPTLTLEQFINYLGEKEFWRQAGILGIGRVPQTGLDELLSEVPLGNVQSLP